MKHLVYIFCICVFGQVLGQPFGEWVQTEEVSELDFANTNPKVGVDGQCNAVAVWVNQDEQSSETTIQGAKLASGSDTWLPTSTISLGGSNLSGPQIEVAPEGCAVILYQSDSLDLFGAKLFTSSTTWTLTNPQPLETGIVSGSYSLAMNASGDVIAAWSVTNTGFIRAARLSAGSTTWSFTEDVFPVFGNSHPVVDINDCGDAVVIWSGFSGMSAALQGARLAAGSNTWEVTTSIFVGNLPTPSLVSYDVALDDSGRAIAVFSSDGVIMGAKLPKGLFEWVPTSDLSDGPDDILPKVKVDGPLCRAVAIWEMEEQAVMKTIEGAVLPFDDTDWVSTNALSMDVEATQAQLAMDEFGNAVAVWNGGDMFIQGATLDASSTAWEQTNDLRMTMGNDVAQEPDVGISPNGQLAVGVWSYFSDTDSEEQIEAATNCSPFTPQPPGLIIGEQVRNVFSTQTECLNRIFWTASPSGNLDFYRIFRDGDQIATVPANKSQVYEDHNRPKGVSALYRVTAVGLNGKESAGVTVTVP